MRRMEEKDLDQIVELEKKCFPQNPWPRSSFEYEFHENPFATILVYEEDDRIIGYVDYWIMYENAQLADIGVDPSVQRHGIGRALMDECIHAAEAEGCEVMSLEVRVSNTPARALYESYGFIQAAVRKGYYENGEDALLMVLPLGGGSDGINTGD
ncbi:MAG: ribosomal protein S18-alanine N-acetyltransferase [Solobacterium sp.]|nr:ribosomal protein S18-alanine N-acetyltransferase [Solobacterium sp.]